MNIIPWEFWNNLWQFWPFLLILIGISVVFGSSYLSRVITTIAAITLLGFAFLSALYETNPDLVAKFPPEIVNTIKNWRNFKRL